MRAIALLMITTILMVPLAGCVDTGDGPQFQLSPEDIEQLIDDNMEDFLNNTSITLNQNVNYYNNSSVQQPSILKSNSGTMTGTGHTLSYGGGLALLIREDAFPATSAGNSTAGLDGARICVGVGTNTEDNLREWFNSLGINFVSVGTADAAEATDKIIAGDCDAMVFEGFYLAKQKEYQLNEDGSVSDGLWVDSRYAPTENSPGIVSNIISVIIPQSSNEMITGIEYLFGQVTLSATCKGNDTSCEDIIQILSIDALSLNMETSCSNNVSFSWSANAMIYGTEPRFYGHGLECTNILNLGAINQIEGVEGYGSTSHELSWSDWTYSVVWESVPIEN